jgi:hypothetical protein
MCNQTGPVAAAAIKRRLITRLRQIDPGVIRQLAEEWAASKDSILLKRHFLVGLCGHWSQGLDSILALELTSILHHK